jgi:hypothetical protein
MPLPYNVFVSHQYRHRMGEVRRVFVVTNDGDPAQQLKDHLLELVRIKGRKHREAAIEQLFELCR